MYNDYLAHHGVPDQKWGVKHGPPYPIVRDASGKPEKTLVSKTKMRLKVNNKTEIHPAIKKRLEQWKQKRAARAESATMSDEEYRKNNLSALRKRVIEHPKELYKHKDEFTKEELIELASEIDFNRKIKDIKYEEVKRDFDRIGLAAVGVKNVVDLGKNLKDVYNIAAMAHNAFVSAGKLNGSNWPILSLGGNQNKGNNQNQDQNQNQNQNQNKGNNQNQSQNQSQNQNKGNNQNQSQNQNQEKQSQSNKGSDKKTVTYTTADLERRSSFFLNQKKKK